MGRFDGILSGVSPPAGSVCVLGVPYDVKSSYMRGPALAPAHIREALHSGSANLCAENGRDLGTEPRFRDVGDLALEGPSALEEIEEAVTELLERGLWVLSLGGDHAITYPIVKAYAAHYSSAGHGRLNLLHLDAHPDLYDAFEGDRYSHASTFARIMEAGLAARLVQVGIRTLNTHQRAQVERFGVEVIEYRGGLPELPIPFEGPVYLSLDLDVLDPAFAPGVSHHEPGGMTTREVLTLIQRTEAPLVGADIVELNPKRDLNGVTAMVAAKLLKEIAARMCGRMLDADGTPAA
jgi:arginase